MCQQQCGTRSLLRDRAYVLIELVDVCVQLPIEGLQSIATIGGMRQQRQRGEDRLALDAPQRTASTKALAECDRLQGMLHPCPHPHPLMAVKQERTQIPLLGRGHPNRRKSILD
jgi:hypothetical protein